MPWDVCVEQYYRAITSFSQSSASQQLEIHFVDKDDKMVDHIKRKFQEFISNCLPFSPPSQSPKSNKSNKLGSSRRAKRSLRSTSSGAKSLDEEEILFYDAGSSITVELYVGDLLKADVKAVVCPQDKKCQSRGGVAKAIMNTVSEVHEKSEENKLLGKFMCDVITLKTTVAVKWDYILHAITPRWGKDAGWSFDNNLGKTIRNILSELDENSITSVAIPLLGAG